jgi:N-carbamoyl-L-amino-acid hydrolase
MPNHPSDNRRIDGARLWDSLMRMAEIGATPKGGVRRLALTDVDRAGRDRFRASCEGLGLAVRTDAMGNMFARREGRDPTRPPVLFGSHLDSQPSGGKFDGALGVMAGLEVMRTLVETECVTEAPLELVNWTDEEGSRFGQAILGSGVWAGVYDPAQVLSRADPNGVTFGDALAGGGFAGSAPASAFPVDAYFELHIEQGPILEREGCAIGVVTGAQGQVWYDAVATGEDSHAGTTPPSARRDALVCAARVVELVDRVMRTYGEDGRGTVGHLVVAPNSRNVVPGEVRFSVEFRHPDDAVIAEIDERFSREAAEIAQASGVKLDLRRLLVMPAQPFDAGCVQLVREAAARLGYSARDIVSGAGHDAVYVARVAPTAMIFTPCLHGLSHNEAESLLPEEAEAGCQVLLEAVLSRADRAITG